MLAPSLLTFLKLVHAWNAKIDLTGARTPAALADVMLADGLVMAEPAIVPGGAHLLDVGAGAGGPAIPLALARPDVRVTMLEPLGKRVAFLRTVIGTLGLASRVSAVLGRIDPAFPAFDGAAPDIACARATFAPTEWLSIGLALAPRVIVLTTPDDVPDGATCTLVHRHDYRWPGSGAPRAIARFDRAGR